MDSDKVGLEKMPGRAVVIKQDDILRADLIMQQNGSLEDFGLDRSIMARMIIRDSVGRENEEGADGWRSIS